MNGLGRLLLVQHASITNHYRCFEHVDIHAKRPVPATGTPPDVSRKVHFGNKIVIQLPHIIRYDHFTIHNMVSGGYGQWYAGSVK